MSDQPLDEDAFRKLNVDHALRQAFLGTTPWSRERYESLYINAPGGPAAYMIAPPYEEYLRLFERYKGRGSSDPDFYIANLMG